MSKSQESVNWSKLPNALPKPKRLHLEEDETDGLFYCPVQNCRHDGFATQRGCRKHVKKKHAWFYFFDEKPDTKDAKEIESTVSVKQEPRENILRTSKDIPSFDNSSVIAKQLYTWLSGT